MTVAQQHTHHIGEFHCESGDLRVSDPCYDTGVWCAGVVNHCRTGKWLASVRKQDCGDWGRRNASLIVTHEQGGSGDEETAPFEVGVDSGQAGVFDNRSYGDATYESWCRLTLSGVQAGSQRHGAVSSSGFGDGGYTATLRRDSKGECFYIRIDFITEDE